MTRTLALLAKDLADLRQNPAVFVPALLTAFLAILLPFFVAIIVPSLAGERLSDSSDFEIALEMYREQPATQALDPEGAIQAWIFQQFLVLLVLAPVAGSMSVAAYSVIGEKQARTLEPLLTTPLSTFELLAAKVLGAFLPALGLTLACFALYVAGVWAAAAPGAFRALLTPASLAVTFLLGVLQRIVPFLGYEVPVAGKSGTAETSQAGRVNAWFIGYAPFDTPRLAVATVLEGFEEAPGRHGSQDAAYITRAVIAAIEHLRQQSFVDARRIGLFGCRRGAVVSAMVAAQVPDLAAVVWVGNPGKQDSMVPSAETPTTATAVPSPG